MSAVGSVLAFLEACQRFDGDVVHAMLTPDWQQQTTPDNAVESVMSTIGWDRKAIALVIGRFLVDLNDTIVGWGVDGAGTAIWIRGPDRNAVAFGVRQGPELAQVSPTGASVNPESIPKFLGSLYERPASESTGHPGESARPRPSPTRADRGYAGTAMDEPWNARAEVARIVGCDPTELSYRRDGQQTHYERAGKPVGRLVVGGPIALMDGSPDSYYEITFEGVDGHMDRWERVRATGIAY